MPTRYPGSATERRALNGYIALMRAARATTERVHGPLRDIGLTLGQFGALEAVHHCGPLRPGELAERILSSCGNITTILDNLEERGLVRREADLSDRRCLRIDLTAEGRRIIKDFFPRHVKRLVAEMSTLTPDELETLTALCGVLGRGGDAARQDG